MQRTSIRIEDLIGPNATRFDMPGGTEPVLLGQLHREDSRAFSVVVMFPPRWRRPVTGHYVSDESFVLLSGDLRIGDDSFTPFDHAYLPAGFTRRTMGTLRGAIAVARFGGPARWVEGAGSDEDLQRRNLNDPHPVSKTPFGLGATLPSGPDSSTYLISAPSATDAASPMEAQIVDLEKMVWHRVAAGSPLPDLTGLALCWTSST